MFQTTLFLIKVINQFYVLQPFIYVILCFFNWLKIKLYLLLYCDIFRVETLFKIAWTWGFVTDISPDKWCWLSLFLPVIFLTKFHLIQVLIWSYNYTLSLVSWWYWHDTLYTKFDKSYIIHFLTIYNILNSNLYDECYLLIIVKLSFNYQLISIVICLIFVLFL